MKDLLLYNIIVCCIIHGQDEHSWTDQLHSIERTAAIDTLIGLDHESSGKVFITPKKLMVRRVAAYGTILLGGLAWRIQIESDKYYDQYLRTGDPIKREHAWEKTKNLDQTSGVIVIGSQLFMQLLIYSYIDDY